MNPFAGRPHQAELFSRIVARARSTNPFYSEWIADPDHVPVLDRTTFVRNNDRILNGHEVTGKTSGSTGEPVRIHTPERLAKMQAADTARYVRLLGGRRKPVVIREIWEGVEGANFVDLATPIDEQIDAITRLRDTLGVDAITTYPSNAEMLCVRILERGIDTSWVTRFGLYAEMVTPAQREQIARAFPQAQTWSTYSASEFAIMGFDCPYEPGTYHLMVHRLGFELVDEAGEPVAAGEPGRVIVTDFVNDGCPFIRYDTGDIATAVGCRCADRPDGGIRLPAIRDIHGKVRGAFLHRDGRRILWSTLSAAFRDMPGMRQYQVIQEELERFTVRVSCAGPLEREIDAAFVDHFGYRPRRIDVEYVDRVPREESGKIHLSICRV